MIVLVIFAWLFSISHCDLEAAGIVPADDCGEVEVAREIPVSDPCDTGCKILEESAFKLDSTKAKFAIVAVLLKNSTLEAKKDPACLLTALELRPVANRDIFLFVARTSLPARAPSFVS